MAHCDAYRLVSSCNLPMEAGTFEMRVYQRAQSGVEAIAMVARVKHGSKHRAGSCRHQLDGGSADLSGVLIRIQDQCMTSEIFGSLKCDCKQQLDYSLATIHAAAHFAWRRRRPTLSSSASGSASVGSQAPTASIDECDARSQQSVGGDAPDARDTDSDGSVARSVGSGSDVTLSVASESVDGDASASVPPETAQPAARGGSSLDAYAKMQSGHVSSGAFRTADPMLQPDRLRNPVSLGDEDVVGVVVYLLQEGRGIGLGSKIAAYALQEDADEDNADDTEGISSSSQQRQGEHGGSAAEAQQRLPPLHSHPLLPLVGVPGSPSPGGSLPSSPGAPASAAPQSSGTRSGRGRGLDTVDANRHLGLPDDAREYTAVVDILRDLGLLQGQERVPCGAPTQGDPCAPRPLRLLTNNPRKLSQLADLGVPIASRVPCHVAPVSPLAARYLRTKAERMGHAIPQGLYDGTG